MKLTIYSIKPAADNSEEMIVTILADNTTASATDITNAAVEPLTARFKEYSDIFPTYSFQIDEIERFGELTTTCTGMCSSVANSGSLYDH